MPDNTDTPGGTQNPIVNSVVLKTITSDRTVVYESRAIEQDEFLSHYGHGVLEPPYNPEQLIRLPEHSDILQQCIDAYKVNIVGFGPRMVYNKDYDKLSKAEQAELDNQWGRFESFFRYSNFDESFTETMMKAIDDRERLGWGVIEVLEDDTGTPAGFEHIPAHKIRLCPKEARPIPVPAVITNEKGEPIEITYMKRFRRFVQIVDGKMVYFKEFGDPRRLDCNTGLYSDSVGEELRATSIIFFNIYSPYTVYGLPRYMGQLLNIQGNRKAEELNYT